ncbi:MAG: hypothetical protein RTU92_04455 [Candidatus Thorarchaeota archaeon]
MRFSRRVAASIGIVLIVVFSTVVAALIYLNSQPDTLEINFIPETVNTIPGEPGWFLVEITTTRFIAEYDVSIQTNVSIDTEYRYWSEAPLLEIFLTPNSSHVESWVEVEVTFSVGSLSANDTALLLVLNWTSTDLPDVIEKRDVFIEYFSIHYSEFNIDNDTEWTPIYNGAGILVVSHYLFRSAEWELAISWHVMIPPHDWVEVYLRPRAHTQPSWAGKVESWSSDNHTIVTLDPPIEIYRSAWFP